MLIYFTLIAVFVFSVVISAVIGYLFHELTAKLLTTRKIRFIAGMVVSVLAGMLMTKLLLFEIWYYYAATVVVTTVLYIVFVRSSNNYSK